MDESVVSIWDHLERQWPVTIGGRGVGTVAPASCRRVGYREARQETHDFLAANGVIPRAFSHYGVVVANADGVLAALSDLIDLAAPPLKKDWVEAYKVSVSRVDLQGTELELIEPAGQSAFADFLGEHHDGLQHLAFQVADVERCLRSLKAAGVDLIDETPRSGSHGKVGFARPRPFAPLHLELCTPLAG